MVNSDVDVYHKYNINKLVLPIIDDNHLEGREIKKE